MSQLLFRLLFFFVLTKNVTRNWRSNNGPYGSQKSMNIRFFQNGLKMFLNKRIFFSSVLFLVTGQRPILWMLWCLLTFGTLLRLDVGQTASLIPYEERKTFVQVRSNLKFDPLYRRPFLFYAINTLPQTVDFLGLCHARCVT